MIKFLLTLIGALYQVSISEFEFQFEMRYR